MPKKRYKPEEIVAKLRQVDVHLSQGSSVADAIRQIGVSEVTYYRWRQEFGGLKISQIRCLQELEAENARLWLADSGSCMRTGKLAGRRLVHAFASRACQPRLELRLRGGPHP